MFMGGGSENFNVYGSVEKKTMKCKKMEMMSTTKILQH